MSVENDDKKYLPKFEWLKKSVPNFPVNACNIKLLRSPSEFYQTLIEQCSNVKSRIVIASLYIGTGKQEVFLINTIKKMLDKIPDLSVRILLDANRGSRGKENSSRTLLLPLINSSNNCRVFLYHTPKLRGIVRWLLAERYNELVGLQHMKVYIFDDNILISGANLSQDYFTNRQDRYILIKDSKPLVDFYAGLIDLVGKISFHLSSENTLCLDSSMKYHPYKSLYNSFASEAKFLLLNYYNSHIKKICSGEELSSDTVVFPLIEFPPFGIHNDSEIITKFLEHAEAESTLNLATGYFNLPDIYIKTLFKKSKANINVLFSHPMANSFQTAKGPASFIPTAYSVLTSNFYKEVQKYNLENRIKCFEYEKTGWTFHSKGLWYIPKNYKWPIFTIIGSSNYGARSLNCDLESQIIILTDNQKLQKTFFMEKCDSYKSAIIYTPNCEKLIVPLWIRFVLKIFKNYF
ncbi:CDP-diacylglycerol--glycerol-3-phosphate 3-phosphatidyltransferase, mitochondrial [Daktulosphaira vitifoliae]|uniref:CDP-diacylglycerol--glycerol-3-phosphate 3-phosphatidyltransferase, mitochondrial n=1 Tax=Daktulosphaira vitifoliae TaxID=58002 RepID=UPI0021AA76A1|nr:CDP-diacylglycerol--glycerol-3-phosphate 3-phosphatidyltransferase, mitochondrial [Daktulosphaira vitifoliae]